MSLPPPVNPGEPTPPRPDEPLQGEVLGRVEPRRVAVRIPQRKPYVTYTLLAVSILIFLLQMLSQYVYGDDYLIALGAKINPLIVQGQLWRLLTPALLHVSLVHIAFNMYALYSIGRGLESHYGHGRFMALYVLAAFAGNTASFLLTDKPSAGASTALFGLIAAEGVFIYTNRRIFGKQSASMLSNLVMLVAINLFLGLSPGIDNWGHLGGLVGGAVFAWLAGPLLDISGEYPDLVLADKRPPQIVWIIAALEAGVILVIAMSGVLRG